MSRKKFIALIAGVMAASIWGGMYVVSKVVLEVIPPFSLLTLRLLLGFVVLAALVQMRGGFQLSIRQLGLLLGVGMMGYGISLGFQFVGTKLSTAANGALVTSATPVLVLPFARWLLNEPITARKLCAVGVASLGVIVVIDPRSVDLSSDLFLGNLSLLAAALTWAWYSTLVRKTAQEFDLLQSSAVFLLGGLPITLPASAWELWHASWGTMTPSILGGILFLGIVSTAVAMFLWNYAFAQLPAALASLTFFAQPLVGTLLGWLFLNEQITPLFIFGGVLIAIGLGIATSNKG